MQVTASKNFYKSLGKYDNKLQQIASAVEKLPNGCRFNTFN